MTTTLSLPGLETSARSARRRGAVPAAPPAERPALLQRLLGERSAAAPVALREAPAAAPASLDALLTATWDGLAAGHTVACVACGEASMAPAGHRGACASCGATLS